MGMEKLATDGSNWPLWQATLLSYCESKNLLKQVEGSAVKPPDPPTFTAGHTLTEDETNQLDKAEERLERYLARESGQSPDNGLSIRISCSDDSEEEISKGSMGLTGNRNDQEAEDDSHRPPATVEEYQMSGGW
jgi:hypothetical protein